MKRLWISKEDTQTNNQTPKSRQYIFIDRNKREINIKAKCNQLDDRHAFIFAAGLTKKKNGKQMEKIRYDRTRHL